MSFPYSTGLGVFSLTERSTALACRETGVTGGLDCVEVWEEEEEGGGGEVGSGEVGGGEVMVDEDNGSCSRDTTL